MQGICGLWDIVKAVGIAEVGRKEMEGKEEEDKKEDKKGDTKEDKKGPEIRINVKKRSIVLIPKMLYVKMAKNDWSVT